MRKILTFIAVILCITSSAQVKQTYNQYGGLWKRIETTVGFRFPRVTTGSSDLNGGPVIGDAYYNESDEYLYTYNGVTWVKLAKYSDAGGAGWSLTGNTGTTAGTNFIGTTDAVDFVIKTANTERIRALSTGNVGIGTDNPTASLHVAGTFRLVDGSEAAGRVLVSDVNGNAAWATTASGLMVPLSSVTALTSNVAINHANRRLDYQWNTLTDGPGILLRSTNTTALDQQLLFQVSLAGTNATNDLTTYAGEISNQKDGTGSVNIGLVVSANNGDENHALKLMDGSEGTGKILRSDATGVSTWVDPTSITTAPPTLQSVLSAGASTSMNNTIVNGANTLTITNNSMTSQGVVISSTSTFANSKDLVTIQKSGDNGTTNNIQDKGLSISNTSAGTGTNYTNYGLYSVSSGVALTNIGGAFSASGGTTNVGLTANGTTYAALFGGTGIVGIGTSTPTSLLHVNGITQMGTPGATLGQLLISGNTSGTITIKPQAAAGTYNFNLPTTAGTSGYVLTSGGGGATAMTWTDPSTLGGGSGLTIGTTSVASGTDTYLLYNNAGTLGNIATTGLPYWGTSGSSVLVGSTTIEGSSNNLLFNDMGNVGIDTRTSNEFTVGDLTTVGNGLVFGLKDETGTNRAYLDNTAHNARLGINNNSPVHVLDVTGGSVRVAGVVMDTAVKTTSDDSWEDDVYILPVLPSGGDNMVVEITAIGMYDNSGEFTQVAIQKHWGILNNGSGAIGYTDPVTVYAKYSSGDLSTASIRVSDAGGGDLRVGVAGESGKTISWKFYITVKKP